MMHASLAIPSVSSPAQAGDQVTNKCDETDLAPLIAREMLNLYVAPPAFEILRDKSAMTVMGFIFTTKQAATV